MVKEVLPMSMLSDNIETFIKALFEDMRQIDVRRNELAEYFRCAPSQINYVLATRFSTDKGYYIESRRGGGGYIRIVRIDMDDGDYLLHLATQGIGEEVSETDARRIIECLLEKEIATKREAMLLAAAISSQSIAAPMAIKDHLRANILKHMVIALIREEAEKHDV
jgi:transcriptional regulator of stress and heat shock response